MKGSTTFTDYKGEIIKKCYQPINLNKEDYINIESAPEGLPVLTLYRVEQKSTWIDISGWVHYKYTINHISGPHEQEFFIH